MRNRRQPQLVGLRSHPSLGKPYAEYSSGTVSLLDGSKRTVLYLPGEQADGQSELVADWEPLTVRANPNDLVVLIGQRVQAARYLRRHGQTAGGHVHAIIDRSDELQPGKSPRGASATRITEDRYRSPRQPMPKASDVRLPNPRKILPVPSVLIMPVFVVVELIAGVCEPLPIRRKRLLAGSVLLFWPTPLTGFRWTLRDMWTEKTPAGSCTWNTRPLACDLCARQQVLGALGLAAYPRTR